MKRILTLSLLAMTALVLVACSGAAAPEPTAVPTNTEEPPTATLEPSATATLEPTATATATATLDKTATAVVKATEAAESIMTELDDLLAESDIPYKEGSLLWKQEETVSISLSEPGGKFSELDQKVTASDFVFKSDVTWDTTGLILCGASFRAEDDLKDGKQYRFLYLRLSGAPAWAIDFYDFGRPKNSITKIKYSDALKLDNGATNQFAIVAQGEAFTVYINGVRQGKFFDYSKQSLEGIFSFIALEDSGESTCTFENSWIWALPPAE